MALVAIVSGAMAVPLGVFIGLPPILVYAATTLTAIAVTWTLLFSGAKLRTAVAARLGHDADTEIRTRQLLEQYGSVGLGLIGPLFPGVIVSTISGVVVGVEPKHLGRWLTAGILLWFAVYTVVWTAVRNGFVG